MGGGRKYSGSMHGRGRHLGRKRKEGEGGELIITSGGGRRKGKKLLRHKITNETRVFEVSTAGHVYVSP